MKPSEIQVPKEKLVLANSEGRLHDKELVTKPISYFRDAFNRFKRNKGSILGAIVIGVLVLYAIIAPIFSPYTVAYNDDYFRYTLPKVSDKFDFLDGCEEKELNENSFIYFYSMGVETGHNSVKNQKYTVRELKQGKNTFNMYKFRQDSYHKTGTVFITSITVADYQHIQEYQDLTGIQVIYPITDPALRPAEDADDANYWYTTTTSKSGATVPTNVTFNDDGTLSYENIYIRHGQNNGFDDLYTSKVRIEGEGNYLYDYALPKQGGALEIRVNYYEYYIYKHSYKLNDGITTPFFLFGTTNYGQDIFTCLASGARFSFILAIVVASVNLLVGAIYGAIEGYYGGKIDLLMERFVEILSAVPFMIVVTLLKYHMKTSPQVLILFISFFLTGWIGMAGRTRMQFYRFKNQEYVLAARTLGAKDTRIMFKHIFPNSLGTLITSSVLVIPGMIFSETSLSYLGIINLSTGNMTSVGTLLAGAQPYLETYPHMILFPSIFICLLMLSFNLFGNGLRDAFNPSLRGAED
jgi:oligopeptide transport system permease protein